MFLNQKAHQPIKPSEMDLKQPSKNGESSVFKAYSICYLIDYNKFDMLAVPNANT